MILRSSSSHDEGEAVGKLTRNWSINTTRLSGANGKLEKLHGVKLEWVTPEDGGRPQMQEVPGSEFEMDVDLVVLAMGFLGPEPDGMIAQLGLKLDGRGNVECGTNYMSSVPGVFAAGDMRRGQSLVVWAISEGRQAAAGVDQFLMGSTNLP